MNHFEIELEFAVAHEIRCEHLRMQLKLMHYWAGDGHKLMGLSALLTSS